MLKMKLKELLLMLEDFTIIEIYGKGDRKNSHILSGDYNYKEIQPYLNMSVIQIGTGGYNNELQITIDYEEIKEQSNED